MRPATPEADRAEPSTQCTVCAGGGWMHYHGAAHDRGLRIKCHWCGGSGTGSAQRATARVAQSQAQTRAAIAPRMIAFANDTRHARRTERRSE